MMQNKIIGITGGVGSGKSVVLRYLQEKYQAYIIEADRLAESLMEPGGSVYQRVVEHFGEGIVDPETGRLDRKHLAEIVFHDNAELDTLNQIVHPLVKEEILHRIEHWRTAGCLMPFVIEAALLIQDGYKEICDELWFIQVDPNIRIERLMKSRGYSEEKCRSIIAAQPEDAFFIENTDYVVLNNRQIDELLIAIDRQIIKDCQ